MKACVPIAIGAGVLLVGCGEAPERPPSALDLYINNCAACHGDQGEGDGPVAPVLGVRVPNLRGLSMRNGGDFPDEAVRAYIDGRSMPAAHGARLMPVWGDEFRTLVEATAGPADVEEAVERRISLLVDHLRGLQYE